MIDDQAVSNEWDANNAKAWNRWIELTAKDAKPVIDMMDTRAANNAWNAWAAWYRLAAIDYEAALTVLATWDTK